MWVLAAALSSFVFVTTLVGIRSSGLIGWYASMCSERGIGLERGIGRMLWGPLCIAVLVVFVITEDYNKLQLLWIVPGIYVFTLVLGWMLEGLLGDYISSYPQRRIAAVVNRLLKEHNFEPKCTELEFIDQTKKTCREEGLQFSYADFNLLRDLDVDEVRKLTDVCARDPSPHGTRDKALIALLYWTGLSRANIVAANLSDYILPTAQAWLRVDGSIGPTYPVYPKEEPEWREFFPDCDYCELVALSTEVTGFVEDWLRFRGHEPGPLFCKIDPRSRLDLTPLSNDLGEGSSNFFGILKMRGQQAGLDWFKTSSFRTFGVTRIRTETGYTYRRQLDKEDKWWEWLIQSQYVG